MKQRPATISKAAWLDLMGDAADDPARRSAAIIRLAHLAVAEHRLQVAAAGGSVRPLERVRNQVAAAVAGEVGR